MDKTEIANNLVKLFADYKVISRNQGVPTKPEYADAVAQAILSLSSKEEEDGNI